jgi:hypothetical protein
MVRTQLYLDEAIHRRLRDMARRQGRTVPTRSRAVGAFGRAEHERAVTLQGIAGLWRDRSDLGDTRAYVRRLRRGTRRARRLQA